MKVLRLISDGVLIGYIQDIGGIADFKFPMYT